MTAFHWLSLAVLALCSLQLSLEAKIEKPLDGEKMFEQFLQELGMDREEFKQKVVTDKELQSKAKDLLMTMKPRKEDLFHVDKPDNTAAMLHDSPLVEYDTPQIIRYYGYPVETHYVTTEDGYNLELHRIPFGKSGNEPGKVREPIIVQHGLLCSSADWVMNPPEQSFGFLLADAGYDVWLPNIRGNTYSDTNTHLSNKDKAFWDFSWNEMGDYDMPAIIDYILYRTGFSQVYYTGHSMGTTMIFVMMDKYPEYNDKVRAFFAMAPVVTIDQMVSPIKIFIPFVDIIAWWCDFLHIYEFLPSNGLMEFLATFLCDDDDFTQFLCSNILFLVSGYNEKQLNTTMLPIYIAHTPAGSSTKTLVHYGQDAQSAIFRLFDYGRDNRDHYGNTAPPLYDLSKTTVPTYFYFGQNDWLTVPADVMEAADKLPNLKLLHKVDDEQWGHLDFMWAIQANTLLYQKIIDEMSHMSLDLKKPE